jgi:asparagine synthase (glutamine-hydrolysing)
MNAIISMTNKNWASINGKTFAIGYAFINDHFKTANELVHLFNNCWGTDQFTELTQTLNGQFSIVHSTLNEVFVCVSSCRSFPVYYKENSDSLFISDNISAFEGKSLNQFSKEQYLLGGFVLGCQTCFNGIMDVPNGCAVVFSNSTKKVHIVETYSVEKERMFSCGYPQLKKMGGEMLERMFDRLIESIGNKPVALLLSGGYDSRLILSGLLKKGYKNITTFTYGNEKNNEHLLAKKVAEKLGVKWHYISYTESFIRNHFNWQEIDSYLWYASNGNSFPSLHEYFAIKEIRTNNLVPDDTIFIPGYMGDGWAGSQYVKVFSPYLQREQVAKTFISAKFFHHNGLNETKLQAKNYLEAYIIQNYPRNTIASSIFEDLDLKERASKWTLNFAKAISFYGYEYRVPFMDKELLEFFSHIPSKYKIGKRLYDDILLSSYFNPMGIAFENEFQASVNQIRIQHFKSKIRRYLPHSIKKLLQKKNDTSFYKVITDYLYNKMRENGVEPYCTYQSSYSEIIIQYVIWIYENRDSEGRSNVQ